MSERALRGVLVLMVAFLLSGCAIAARSDKFGADLDLGIGGILSYIADLHLKMSVGFSKTCPDKPKRTKKTPTGKDVPAGSEKEDADEQEGPDPDPLGLDHFL